MQIGLDRTTAPHARAPYASGAAGVRQSIEAVVAAALQGMHDPDVRGWVVDTLAAAGCDGRSKKCSVQETAQAILDAVRKQTIYAADPANTEWVQAPHVTLCLRDVCIRGGDCDDLTALVLAALLAAGLAAFAVKQSFGSGQDHILVGVLDEQGGKLYVDAANTTAPVYSGSKALSEVWIDPFQGAPGNLGAAPQIVTLGAAQERDLSRVDGVWTERRYGEMFMHRGGRWFSSRSVGLGAITWHTMHELSDLVKALQTQVDDISASYENAKAAWSAADNAGFLAWEQAYNTALATWNPTAARANAAVTASLALGGPIDWDWQPTIEVTGEDLFDSVAKAFQPFEDLDRELRASPKFPPADLPDYSNTPQPTAPDFSLEAYKMADKGARAVENLGKQITTTLNVVVPWVALGIGAAALVAVLYYLPPRRKT